MAGTFLRFDFKLFLTNWLIAVLNSAVLKLADAPNIHVIFNPNQVIKPQGNKVVQYFKILNSVLSCLVNNPQV